MRATSSDPDEIKQYKKNFFICLYTEKEFTTCWKKAFENDKNYNSMKNIVDTFFGIIGNVKISELDTIVQSLASRRGIKLIDIMPAIKEFCRVVERGGISLDACKDPLSNKINLSRCCDSIRKTADNISQFKRGADIGRCSQQEGCKLCYDKIRDVGNMSVILLVKNLSCNGCSDANEKGVCENLVDTINPLCSRAIGIDGEEKAIENFLNNWQNLMEIINNNYCSFQGIDEEYCKEKIDKDVLSISLSGRIEIERVARQNGYLSLYKQTLMKILEDNAPLEKIDCNNLY